MIVAVKDSLDGLVVTLIDGLPQAAGVSHQLTWNGRNASSAPAPDGLYTIRFASGNSVGQDDDTKELKLDATRPLVERVDLSQNPFTPDLPGSPDSLRVRLLVGESNTLDTTDSLTVAAGPAASSEVDDLLFSPSFGGDGEYTAYWKPAGHADGRYEVRVSVADDAGNSSSVTAPFTLDTNAPLVGISDPADGAVFRDLPDSIFGRAYDPSGVQEVEIAYDSGRFLPVVFTTVGDTAVWGAVLRDSLPGPGEHTVAVRAADSLGHTGSAGALQGPSSITLTSDVEPPPVPTLNSLPEFVRTEDLNVSGHASQAAEVSLFLNNIVAPAAVVSVSAAGSFQTTISLQPGPNSIRATASDAAGNVSDLSAPVTVEYRLQFGVFFNERFRPGDSFEITLDEPARRITIALYTMSGRLVRVLRAEGASKSYSVEWDGADHAGSGVNNGIYLCRVTAGLQDGSEITDKKLVALVR